MNVLKQKRFWLSIIFAAGLFALIFPYYHDMYIAPLHTALCIFLNGVSSLLFAVLLYQVLGRTFTVENSGIFVWFLLLQGVGHAGFAVMNWGSWLCLAVTAAALAWIAVFRLKRR